MGVVVASEGAMLGDGAHCLCMKLLFTSKHRLDPTFAGIPEPATGDIHSI